MLLASRRVAHGSRPAGMVFILATVLIDMLAIGLVMPVLPALIGALTGSRADQAFWYGAMVCAFGGANFLCSSMLGALSDSMGRRPVLLLGFCGLGLTFFITALASSVWALLLVRLVGGAMQANLAVAHAYVADISRPEQRTANFGLMSAMVGLGFVLGPLLGGSLGLVDVRLPFWVAGMLALVNLGYGYAVLPESLKPASRRPFAWRAANPLLALARGRSGGRIGWLMAVSGLIGLAQMLLFSSWVLYTEVRFGWTPLQTGLSLAVFGVASMLAQGLLVGPVSARFGARRLLVAGLLSLVLVYGALGAAPSAWMVYPLIAGNLLGFMVAPLAQGLISRATGSSEQGRVLGAVQSLNSLMAVLAPLLSVPLLLVVVQAPRGSLRTGAPLYLCAALALAALACLAAERRQALGIRRQASGVRQGPG